MQTNDAAAVVVVVVVVAVAVVAAVVVVVVVVAEVVVGAAAYAEGVILPLLQQLSSVAGEKAGEEQVRAREAASCAATRVATTEETGLQWSTGRLPALARDCQRPTAPSRTP